MLDEQRNVNGTYVTDDTSYITVSETGRYEYVEVTLEDGTVDTEQVPLEDVQFDFKIVTATVGDDEATGAFTYLLTLEYNGKEIELRKDMDLESNYNANYYDYETAVSEDDTDGVSEETVDIDVNATSDDSILYEEQATDTVTVEQ
jgi:hypothetical protein